MRSLTVASGVALLAACPAAAKPLTWPEGSLPAGPVENLAQGPVLIDGEVAWLDYTSKCSNCASVVDDYTEQKHYSLRETRPSRKPRVLFTTESSDGSLGGQAAGFSGNISFALSRSFLAIQATDSYEGTDGSTFDLRLGAGARRRSPGGADLASVFECSTDGFSEPSGAFALSGPLLAYDSTPCGAAEGTTNRLTVRDLSTGRRRSERFPAGVSLVGLASAGEFVATSLVTSAAGGRGSAYSVALFQRGRAGPLVTLPVGKSRPFIALQRDGRVAVCTEDRRLATFSPAEPKLRDLGGCEGSVSVAEDRLVFRAPRARALQVSNLAGRRATIARVGRVDSYGVDFDGRRIVYALQRCHGGPGILRTTVSTRGNGSPLVKCPAIIGSRGRLRVRRGRTSFRLACPRGCDGYFDLLRGGETVESRSIDMEPGRSTVTARIGDYGRRALAKGRTLRVKLKVVAFNRDGGRSTFARWLRLSR